MTIPVAKNIELIENKLNTLEVVVFSLIGALDRLIPGTGKEACDGIVSQAEAARRRGNEVAWALLTGAASTIEAICDPTPADSSEI